jgi:hypothetical protein
MSPRALLFDGGIPNKSAVRYPCVKRLLKQLHDCARTATPACTLDLFCGDSTKDALPFSFSITNDIDPQKEATHHMDALALLRTLEDDSCALIFADPPFSPNQVEKKYGNHGANIDVAYMHDLFAQIERVLAPAGRVVVCGFDGAAPAGLRTELVLVCTGGGEKNPMVVTVAATAGSANLPEELVDALGKHEPIKLYDTDHPLLESPKVCTRMQKLLKWAQVSVSVCDPGRHNLRFTRYNNVQRGSRSCPNKDDLQWLLDLEPQSVDVAMCVPPDITEGGKIYQRYKMLYTPRMHIPTSTGYAAGLKEQINRIVRFGGHLLWVSVVPGGGFKVRGWHRDVVFMRRRGVGTPAVYATFLERVAESDYDAKRVPRKPKRKRGGEKHNHQIAAYFTQRT